MKKNNEDKLIKQNIAKQIGQSLNKLLPFRKECQAIIRKAEAALYDLSDVPTIAKRKKSKKIRIK